MWGCCRTELRCRISMTGWAVRSHPAEHPLRTARKEAGARRQKKGMTVCVAEVTARGGFKWIKEKR